MSEEIINPYPASSFDFEARPLSYSSLKHILTSPLHFADNWHHGKSRKKTDDLFFGSLVDDLLFFPDEFNKKYTVKPKFEGTGARTREKEWKDENKSMQFATNEQIREAKIMAENIKTNPITKWLYEATTAIQQTMIYTDKKTGLKFICKMDSVAEFKGRTIIWDLKTAADASNEQYQKDASKWGYPLQGHMYCNAYIRKSGKFPEFYNIVAEKGDPYAVNNFRADATFMQVGKKQFEIAVERILYCMEHDCFNQGYEFMNIQGYNILSVPYYEKTKWLD